MKKMKEITPMPKALLLFPWLSDNHSKHGRLDLQKLTRQTGRVIQTLALWALEATDRASPTLHSMTPIPLRCMD
jgi:hypothetical protein